MTAYADAVDDLAGALTSGGIRVAEAYGGEAPYAVIYSDGVATFDHVVRGAVAWSFRVILVADVADGPARDAAMAALRAAAITAARGLAGWRLDRLERDAFRDTAGVRSLTADLIVSTMVDI